MIRPGQTHTNDKPYEQMIQLKPRLVINTLTSFTYKIIALFKTAYTSIRIKRLTQIHSELIIVKSQYNTIPAIAINNHITDFA